MPPKTSALPPQVVQITHGSGEPPKAIAGPMRQPRAARVPFDPASVELGSDEEDFATLVAFARDCKEKAEETEAASAAASWGNLALRVMREVVTLRREIIEARKPAEEKKGRKAPPANPFLVDSNQPTPAEEGFADDIAEDPNEHARYPT